MKTLALLFTLMMSHICFASGIDVNSLTAFADKYSYKDNRKSLQKDQMYSAYKDCCDEKPYAVLEAYKGLTDFKQVALWCDHCSVKEMSAEQITYCQSEFANLYSVLFKKTLEASVLEKIQSPADGKAKIISEVQSPEKIRLTSGVLKCDGKGGNRLRLDIFVK